MKYLKKLIGYIHWWAHKDLYQQLDTTWEIISDLQCRVNKLEQDQK